MNDITRQVENLVKDALARACQAQGIDKSEVGWGVGGGGVVAPQMVRDPNTGESGIVGFAPCWVVMVSVRHRLIGSEPVCGSLPIYDVLPTKGQIDPVVAKILGDVVQIREQQFQGANGQAGQQPGLGGLIS